jgi:hypothetical protein
MVDWMRSSLTTCRVSGESARGFPLLANGRLRESIEEKLRVLEDLSKNDFEVAGGNQNGSQGAKARGLFAELWTYGLKPVPSRCAIGAASFAWRLRRVETDTLFLWRFAIDFRHPANEAGYFRAD